MNMEPKIFSIRFFEFLFGGFGTSEDTHTHTAMGRVYTPLPTHTKPLTSPLGEETKKLMFQI